MKNAIFPLIIVILLASCGGDDDNNTGNDLDYRQKMREFVIAISSYSKTIHPDFSVIPQNGIELVTGNGESSGQPVAAYLDAINGNGQEDLFYGYENDNEATPSEDSEYLTEFLNISKDAGNTILAIDYCSTPAKMDDSYTKNHNNGYVSFAADERNLNNIPAFPATVYQENNVQVNSLAQIKNFLYLINPENYSTKADFINAVRATNYDLLIMDLYFNDGTAFSASEIGQLKSKANGGSRLVVCYMSIGEAENYRYYWQQSWETNKPDWLDAENPDWEGNYKVKYWNTEWQSIIYGNDNSYLKKILDAGFDGVYLDIIDAFEYYE
jgi:cysteinyl-tRNA synthetase, unknown class